MKKIVKEQKYSNLITDIASFIEQGRKTVVQYVNTTLVVTYWLVGRRIVEYEQKGERRAKYGEALLKKLSLDLTKHFGKGFSFPQIKNIRQFYLAYQEKSYTVSSQLQQDKKSQTLSSQSDISHTLSAKFFLSWSHYCLLMRMDEPLKREFYEAECVQGNWSVRQLDRQIQSMLYERTALSKRKMAVISKAHEKPVVLEPEDEIKDPYILEFLGLKDEYSESQLEEALIKHLEHFLLE